MSTIKLEDIMTSSVRRNDSQLVVEMPDEKLSVGGHTFQLQVEDDSGNISAPAQVLVIVLDTQAPTAVVTLANANGRPVPGNRIAFGSNFILNGKNSVDSGGGKIVSYNWSLLE